MASYVQAEIDKLQARIKDLRASIYLEFDQPEIIRHIIEYVFGFEEDAWAWLCRPNSDFRGMTPLDLIREGRAREVHKYLNEMGAYETFGKTPP